MLRKVRKFIGATPVSSRYGDLTKPAEELSAVVDRVDGLAQEQELHDRNYHSAVRTVDTLFVGLKRDAIHPIATMSNSLVPPDPGVAERIRMADLGGHQATITYALKLADRLEPQKDKFIAAGLKPDFIEHLRADVTKFQAALDECDEHLRRRTGATAALEREYARGKKLVRVMGRLLRSAFEVNPKLKAEWENVSRIPRRIDAEDDSTNEDVPTVPSVAEGSNDRRQA